MYKLNDQATTICYGTPGEAGTSPTRNQRHIVLGGPAHYLANLFSVTWQDHPFGPSLVQASVHLISNERGSISKNLPSWQ
jgi:hypothetical protein